jgi:hypothetical protein
VIRNAVLHLFNEQPLVADLYRAPDPADVGLVCTNLRLKNGSRPVFIDEMSATVFIPYGQIRFVEIPAASMAAAGAAPAAGTPAVAPASSALVPVAGAAAGEDGPVPGAGGVEGSGSVTAAPGDATDAPGAGATGQEVGVEPESDADLELDEDFLRRIRDI